MSASKAFLEKILTILSSEQTEDEQTSMNIIEVYCLNKQHLISLFLTATF